MVRLLRGWLGLLLCLPGGVQAAPEPAPAGTTIQPQWAELQRAWRRSPATAALPWPELGFTEASPLQACPSASGGTVPPAPARAASPPAAAESPVAVYCPATGRILIQRRGLAMAQKHHAGRGVAYWLALALAEALQHHSPTAVAAGYPERQLQAVCLAGVLLSEKPVADGGSPKRSMQQSQWQALRTAYLAYSSALDGRQGTGVQRAYALASGMGSTRGDCGTTAIGALARSQVPDPASLTWLAGALPDDKGIGMGGPIGLREICSQPPRCPRVISLGQSFGFGGI